MSLKSRITKDFDAAVRHHKAGRLREAEGLYRHICKADPNHAANWHGLAVLLHQTGRQEALYCFEQAIKLQPHHAEIHNDFGAVLGALGRFEDACAAFTRAADLRPDYAEAHNNLGRALVNLNRIEEALTHFQKAAELEPADAMTQVYIGNSLRQLSRLGDAIAHFEKALSVDRNCVLAHYHLGLVLTENGRREQAITHYREAVRCSPQFIEAHINLANLLSLLGQFDAAISHYQHAASLRPNFSDLQYQLGTAYRRCGEYARAQEAFKKAVTLNPNHAEARLACVMTNLPAIYRNENEITERRTAYFDGLNALQAEIQNTRSLAPFADAIGSSQPFYLAYQGMNDRDLQALYGSVVCHIMASRYGSALPRVRAADGLIKVGFVSGFFYRHSNWKIPIKGWLENLDQQKFKVFAYSTGQQQDAYTQVARNLCQRFVDGIRSIDEWRNIIIADAPDILIYPEIGMDKICAQLAAQRLAPVQCVSWGHPTTSGFPTIDYFLSSDLMEPADAEAHYTEELVRLPKLSIYCEPAALPQIKIPREELGLREDAIVYWCGQSMSKYLSQYDEVFPQIARESGNCQFVFIEFSGAAAVTKIFEDRLTRAFAKFGLDVHDYCVILLRQDPDRFIAAMGTADIFLDSIGWSGCNSTLESLVHDLPILTMKAELMRSRHTAAILEVMGLSELITETLEDYVALAIRLAMDRPLRMAIKSKIATRKGALYRDRTCIIALEDFLQRAVQAADKACRP